MTTSMSAGSTPQLTAVSVTEIDPEIENMDPVMLAHERDSAWALMLHHQRAAERAKNDEKQLKLALNRAQPATQALYSISNLISRRTGTPRAVTDTEFIRLVTENVVSANRKVQELIERQKEKESDG